MYYVPKSLRSFPLRFVFVVTALVLRSRHSYCDQQVVSTTVVLRCQRPHCVQVVSNSLLTRSYYVVNTSTGRSARPRGVYVKAAAFCSSVYSDFTMVRTSSKARGRGKGRGRQLTTPPPPSPVSESDDSNAASEPVQTQTMPTTQSVANDDSSLPSSRDASPATVSQPSKKSKKISDLSMEEEDSMAEWIRDNECLYNKKVNSYKDFILAYLSPDARWRIAIAIFSPGSIAFL